jgi:glycyl-tRNA synthetase alpha chain
MNNNSQNILNIKIKLENFWKYYNVQNLNTWDMEMAAATFHPISFFKILKNQAFKYMYVQPSRRLSDGKYGMSPNRVIKHHQFQVIINPFTCIDNIQEVFLKSLEYIGIDLEKNDIRFIENNWENTSLGAFGVGWEIWINGMEVTQFTFFTKMADITLNETTVELAYGLERLALILNKVNSFFDLQWDDETNYKELFFDFEVQQTKYYLDIKKDSSPHTLVNLETNFYTSLKNQLYYPCYEIILKLNQELNSLIAHRDLDQITRKKIITKIRNMTYECAKLYLSLSLF